MLQAGTIVGNDFKILRLLKEGGMGAVYVAEQLSLRERRALKVMRSSIPGLDDPERLRKYRERFLEEARRSSGLRSAHVVKVVASGVDEGAERPWLAMELLHGEDLDDVLHRKGRLSWDETRVLFEQVGHGLAAAHGAGVLHLDLKPENLFVAEPESPGVPFTMKVLDFGIGRVLEEQRTSVTATTAVGSPLWMSPEQALKQRVSAATDLWALGLIAYRCITGRHYWREANKTAEEFAPTGWLLELMTQPLEAASTRAREQGADTLLPAGFDAWFARCVTRDREARWQSVHEMLEHLRRLGSETVPSAASTLGAATSHAPTLSLGDAASWMDSCALAPTMQPASPVVAKTVALSDAPSPTPAPSSPARSARRLGVPAAFAVSVIVGLAAAWGIRHRAASSPDRTRMHANPERLHVVSSAATASRSSATVVASADAGLSDTLTCPDGTALVRGGHVSVTRSDADASTQTVEVPAFCMTTVEVQVSAYRSCVRDGACAAPERGRACNLGRDVFDDTPVRCVPWQSAVDYCAWWGGRLPTDAEWELAARGDVRTFPWGNEVPSGDVNWSGVAFSRGVTVSAAMSFDRTPEGVFDLAGNVSEWVSDGCRQVDGDPARFVREEGASGHINRGGNFITIEPGELTRRECLDPSTAAAWGGFRCVSQPIEQRGASSSDGGDAGALASD